MCIFRALEKGDKQLCLSSPSSFRALGVRVAEGKNAKAYVFMCVFESKGFTTEHIFVGDPLQCNH